MGRLSPDVRRPDACLPRQAGASPRASNSAREYLASQLHTSRRKHDRYPNSPDVDMAAFAWGIFGSRWGRADINASTH